MHDLGSGKRLGSHLPQQDLHIAGFAHKSPSHQPPSFTRSLRVSGSSFNRPGHGPLTCPSSCVGSAPTSLVAWPDDSPALDPTYQKPLDPTHPKTSVGRPNQLRNPAQVGSSRAAVEPTQKRKPASEDQRARSSVSITASEREATERQHEGTEAESCSPATGRNRLCLRQCKIGLDSELQAADFARTIPPLIKTVRVYDDGILAGRVTSDGYKKR